MAAPTVVTLIQALSLACNTACHYEGYDAGFAWRNKCKCVDVYDQDILLRLKKGVTTRKPSPSSPSPEQNDDRPTASYDSE